MNTIEEQLWDYIDGNLDENQSKALEKLINSDNEIKLKYEELLHFNRAFDDLDLDEPSLSFTRNVMESIAVQPAPMALKTRVDKKIIYSIGAFFVLTLLTILGYAVYSSNLQFNKLDISMNFDINKLITPTTLYIFLFSDLIIGLIFMDYWLRKKLSDK